MKKRILLILTCILVLLLTACGGRDPKTADYNGHSYDELQSVCQYYVDTLEAYDLKQIEAAIEVSPDDVPDLMKSWAEIRPELGEFKGYGEFTVTQAGKTLMAEQEVEYENRPAILTCVYNYRDMEMTDATIERVYTTGEKMKRAGLNTVMCMAIVFAVLIVISLLILSFKLFAAKGQKKPEESANTAESAASVEPVQEAGQDKKKLFAIIAAAVAAYTGNSSDTFHVTSVRKTEEEQ